MAAVAAIAIALSWFKTSDPDFFWLLECGQIMIKQKALMTANTLSEPFRDYQWSNPSWLFQLALAIAYNAGGWLGVSIFKALLSAGLGLVFYKISEEAGAGILISAALAITALASSRFIMTERPHLVSALLFGMVILFSERLRRGEKFPALWAIPLVFAIWSNFHLLNTFGLIYLFAIPLLESARAFARGERPEGPSLWLLGVGFASVAAAALNPEGFGFLTYVVGNDHLNVSEMVGLNELMWSSPADHPVFYATILLAVIAFACSGKEKDWALAATLLVFIALGIRYRRATPEASVVAMVLFAKTYGGTIRRKITSVFAGMALVCGSASLAFAFGFDNNLPYKLGYGLDSTGFPAAACDFAIKNRVKGPLFNEFGVGGYVAWRLYPDYGVLQDGRIHAYPPEFFVEFQNTYKERRWPEFLDKYGMNSGIIATRYLPMVFDEKKWAVIFWDNGYSVVARRESVTAQFLDQFEYRLFLPSGAVGVSSPEDLSRIEYEARRNYEEREAPDWRILCFLADARMVVGNQADAKALLGEAAKVGERSEEALISVGNGLLNIGETQSALESFTKALALNPSNNDLKQFIEKLKK